MSGVPFMNSMDAVLGQWRIEDLLLDLLLADNHCATSVFDLERMDGKAGTSRWATAELTRRCCSSSGHTGELRRSHVGVEMVSSRPYPEPSPRKPAARRAAAPRSRESRAMEKISDWFEDRCRRREGRLPLGEYVSRHARRRGAPT